MHGLVRGERGGGLPGCALGVQPRLVHSTGGLGCRSVWLIATTKEVEAPCRPHLHGGKEGAGDAKETRANACRRAGAVEAALQGQTEGGMSLLGFGVRESGEIPTVEFTEKVKWWRHRDFEGRLRQRGHGRCEESGDGGQLFREDVP